MVAAVALAEPPAAPGATGRTATNGPGARVLILVGLPGNEAHQTEWRGLVRRWRVSLTGSAGFDPGVVRVLAPRAIAEDAVGPATREAIASEIRAIRAQGDVDRLWVFWLGHTSHDGDRLWLHLPGPDLSGDELGRLLGPLRCRESVFWLTSAGSGWLVGPLAAPGRVLVAATQRDQEFNETVFPRALADVMERPPRDLDRDRDGRVSVLELFTAAADATSVAYEASGSVPTEHAQLDDNGDGVGTEPPVLAAAPPAPTAAAAGKPAGPARPADGDLAAHTLLPAPGRERRDQD